MNRAQEPKADPDRAAEVAVREIFVLVGCPSKALHPTSRSSERAGVRDAVRRRLAGKRQILGRMKPNDR